MKHRAFIVLLIVLFAYSAMGQEASLFEKHTFESPKDGKSLNYRLLKPDDIKPGKTYPLVLFLHGAGERGTDNISQLKHGVTEFAKDPVRSRHPAFVIAPQCPSEKTWVDVAWDEEVLQQPENISTPLRLALEITQKTIRKYSIDPARVYATGLSMGGFGAWDLIYRQPGMFAAAVPVCGGAAPEIAPAIKDIPVWNFHGAEDQVVPVSLSRSIHTALQRAGGRIIYTEIPGMGHNSWDEAYHMPEMYNWLFAQER